MSNYTVLVTGGAGYIGSHVVVDLLTQGFTPIVIDNYANSVKGSGTKPEVILRIENLTGKEVPCYGVDIRDKPGLQHVFKQHPFTHVIHAAGLKAVGESIRMPIKYYDCNVGGTITLLEVMQEFDCYNIIFSSSATVYGPPDYLPVDEKHHVGRGITNPYGKTKYFTEEILRDLAISDSKWNVVILRYFNPVGAHKSGRIGENPQGIPSNLMPFVSQVAVGRRGCVKVFGTDYDTPDGTGVRDYIHVLDLASGHVAAVEKASEGCGLKVYNLGSGKGYSVLDMIKAMERACGKEIKYEVMGRRDGDIGSVYANAGLAEIELNWKAERGLDEMCEDQWRWQSNNPKSF